MTKINIDLERIKNELKNHLIKNKFKDFFNASREYLYPKSSKKIAIENLVGRFQNIKSDDINGIIEPNQKIRLINKIRLDCLELVYNLTITDLKIGDDENYKTPISFQYKKAKFIALRLISILVFFCVVITKCKKVTPPCKKDSWYIICLDEFDRILRKDSTNLIVVTHLTQNKSIKEVWQYSLKKEMPYKIEQYKGEIKSDLPHGQGILSDLENDKTYIPLKQGFWDYGKKQGWFKVKKGNNINKRYYKNDLELSGLANENID